MLEFEFQMFKGKSLAGVDEVGRGPLAGPVVCACVALPLDDLIAGVKDSKKLTPKRREELFWKIAGKATEIKISLCDHTQIDKINILNATKKAMTECINNMKTKLDYVLVDAVRLSGTKYPVQAFIKGDDRSYLIAAASIVAKVARDKMMVRYDKVYSGYGFCDNKGYATKQHIEAIKEKGLTPIHRHSFVKHFLEP